MKFFESLRDNKDASDIIITVTITLALCITICFGCAQKEITKRQKYNYETEKVKLQQIELLKNNENVSIEIEEK
jgi:hypothetical protein